MTKLAVLAAAEGMLLAAPTFNTAASAAPAAGIQVAQLSVEVGHDRDRRWRHRHHHCRKTVIWRHHRKTVIRRCD
jgi:hypothetical protein